MHPASQSKRFGINHFKSTQMQQKYEKRKQSTSFRDSIGFSNIKMSKQNQKQNNESKQNQMLETLRINKNKSIHTHNSLKKNNMSHTFTMRQPLLPTLPRQWNQNSDKQMQIQVLKDISSDYEKQIAKTIRSFKQQKILNVHLKQQTQALRKQIYEMNNIQIQFQELKTYCRKLQAQIVHKEGFNENLKKDLSSVQQQLQQSKLNIVQWISKAQGLEKRNKVLQQRKVQSNVSLIKCTQEAQLLKVQVKYLNDQLQVANSQIVSTQQRSNKYLSENENLLNQIQLLNLEKAQLRTKISEIQECSMRNNEQLQKEQKMLQEYKTERQRWFEQKNSQSAKEIEDKLIILKNKQKSWFDQKLAYEYKISSLVNEIQDLKQSNQILTKDSNLRKIQNSKQILQKQYRDTIIQIKNQKIIEKGKCEQCQAKQVKIRLIQDRKCLIERQFNSIKSKIQNADEIKTENQKLIQNSKQKRQQISELKQEIKQLKISNKQLEKSKLAKQTIQKLQNRSQSISNQNKQLSAKLRKLQMQNAQIKQNFQTSQETVQELKKINHNLNCQFDDVSARLKQALGQLQSKTIELSQFRQEMEIFKIERDNVKSFKDKIKLQQKTIQETSIELTLLQQQNQKLRVQIKSLKNSEFSPGKNKPSSNECIN